MTCTLVNVVPTFAVQVALPDETRWTDALVRSRNVNALGINAASARQLALVDIQAVARRNAPRGVVPLGTQAGVAAIIVDTPSLSMARV